VAEISIALLSFAVKRKGEPMSDLIERQDALDALEKIGWIETKADKEYAIQLFTDLPSAQPEPCEDAVSREAAIDAALSAFSRGLIASLDIRKLPSVQPKLHWIPVSERLPESIRPVIVTWKNTDPASYYQYIVGKHFTGTACYKNGKWYWYSSTTEDMLAEYGRYDSEEFDEAIECIAWMPLPEPYVERRTDDKTNKGSSC
jgi:hypothetical protein